MPSLQKSRKLESGKETFCENESKKGQLTMKQSMQMATMFVIASVLVYYAGRGELRMHVA